MEYIRDYYTSYDYDDDMERYEREQQEQDDIDEANYDEKNLE